MMAALRSAVGAFALLGAVSGATATGMLFVFPQNLELRPFPWLELNALSLAPGLVFGLLMGAALVRRGAIDAQLAAAYVAVSTVSYLAAYTVALQLADEIEAVWQIGMLAGLFGSACLTLTSASFLPFLRRLRPCLLLLVAGCALGALLELPIRREGGFPEWLALFAPWQAGYAAAFATALPETRAGA